MENETGSSLQDKLTRMDAVYQQFGRDGMKDFSLPEVSLLLRSKELAFRDMPKGRDLGDGEKAAARQLELEINDLTAFVKSQMALVVPNSLQGLRQYGEQL